MESIEIKYHVHKIKLSRKNIQAKIGSKGKCEWNPDETEENLNAIDLNLIISTIIGHGKL